MALLPPIMLSGDNLGQRHRYLNTLVREAKKSGATIQDVETFPEESPVDRLFKIDLAIELNHLDYIIHNLKDDDMLYVSRALKSTWLIDRRDIINPKYLEDVLFPEMITPAVTKMKHWLYINLQDPAMCQKFYQHYRQDSLEFAIKFLRHCSYDFILTEAPKILIKLSPHSLKVLCEKCPRVAKIYFDSLATDEDVKARYLQHEHSYYNSVKCVLKSDADVFLDITEKYFAVNRFNRLSPLATDYILRCHKTRFTNKLELYVAYLLHIPTLAARLSVEECQEVVLKLARASYLQHWFKYKAVEPLIKRIRPDKRAAFKKLVFVEKDIGERVQKWPYPMPTSPPNTDSGRHILDRDDFWPMYKEMGCCGGMDFRCMLKKRKYCKFGKDIKSDLDRLFDEFRFVGFERTLHEMGQRLRAAGSADKRRDIFLVLVSKTGGRSDAVSALLRLAARHTNEPPHTRASILRSLVKRANVWRLPTELWQHFLDFGHGLGLNGAPSEAACREGLHCVVIRQLLAGECQQAVRDAFLNDFSTLADYSLNVDERERIANGLQNMLALAATDVDPAVAAERLCQLLDVILVYHICGEAATPTVEAAKSLALRDAEVARSLLERLYDARIGRRELLRVNLKFRCDQRALINALRHDPSALELENVTDILIRGQSKFDVFVSKLMIYFNQKEDLLTIQLRSALKAMIITQQNNESRKNVKLARPLASLLYKDFEKELRELDAAGKENINFAAALRACAHRARPIVILADWGWRKADVKAIATRAMRCRKIERAELTRVLIAERRTVRVALALSMRSTGPKSLLLETFASAAKLRPVVTLHMALSYFRRHGATADPGVWDIVKPLLFSVDLKPRDSLRRLLSNTDWISPTIKPDYCGTLYLVLEKISKSGSDFMLHQLCLHLPEIREDMMETILLLILEQEPKLPYPAIFMRFLMLSRDREDLERKFTEVGDRFLKILENLRCGGHRDFQLQLDIIIQTLKYNAAFLDTKYTSCLSVIEKFLDWLQTFMPKEEYFDKYVHIHLTMLYFKAVRQSMKQMPEVFADPNKRKSEGAAVVGFAFGRYIVKEVAELVNTYFDSILELYMDALIDYVDKYFTYGISRAQFYVYILKAMLVEAVGIQRRMAVYLLRGGRYDIEDYNMKKEIEEIMEQDKCIELLVHAEIFN